MRLSSFLGYRGIVLLVTAVFFSLTLWASLANQLCCADDSGFAVVAKNVATGVGYAYSLNYHGPDFAVRIFDPWIGGGPVLIFGTALLIKIFGVKAWVPGLTTVLLCSTLVFLLGLQLRVFFSARKATVVLLSFLSLILSLSLFDFNYWSALLGEGVASLFIVMGYVYWASSDKLPRYAFYSGLCMCLAFLTKEIAALHIISLVIFIALSSLSARWRFFSVRHVLLLAAGLAIPLLVFELYRLSVLGSVHAYIGNWVDHLDFIHDQGSNDHPLGLPDYIARIGAFVERSGLRLRFVLIGFLLAAANIVWGESSSRSATIRLSVMMVIGLLLHSSYWIFLSIGWVRYAFYAVALFSFLVALACDTKSVIGLSGVVFCAFLWAHNWTGVQYVWRKSHQIENGQPSEMVSAHAMLDFIKSNDIKPPIYTGWWADVPALEYLQPHPGTFMGYQVALLRNERPATLLSNDRFPVTDKSFTDLVASCHVLLKKQPYTLYDCANHPQPAGSGN